MEFPYSPDFWPAAPVMDIWLGRPDEQLTVGPLQALVDSGADATVVPARFLRALAPVIDDRKYLRDPWGGRRPVDIHFLDVGIGGDRLRFPVVEIVADDTIEVVLLGRNLLNQFVVTLHGPEGRTVVPE